MVVKSLLLAALVNQAMAGAVTSNDMGPAAFMWPPDRVWSAALDNTAPCGSSASVGNRTQFPLSKLFKPRSIHVTTVSTVVINSMNDT